MSAAALPDFTRTAWPSPTVRERFEPLVHRAAAAWAEIERWSVVASLPGDGRLAGLLSVTPEMLPAAQAWAWEHALEFGVFSTIGASATYASSGTPAQPGQAFTYRCGLARTPLRLRELGRAFMAGDDGHVGDLLGYPTCCRAYFAGTWGAGSVDPTWEAVLNTVDASRMIEEQREVTLHDSPDPVNILGRWLGVRAVGHMPCRFDCPASLDIAKGHLELADRLPGVDAGALREVLSWAVEYVALHGIATVTFPVCRVVTRTDWTAEPRTLYRAGIVPEGAPRGGRFPFRGASLAPVHEEPESPAWIGLDQEAKLNGFSSHEAMSAAHTTIVEAVAEASQGIEEPCTVLDLGCGTGALLRELARMGATCDGIDSDPKRITYGREASTDVTFGYGSIYNATTWGRGRWDVALLGFPRLEEATPDELATLLGCLVEHVRAVVLYSYGLDVRLTAPRTKHLGPHFERVQTLTGPSALAIVARNRQPRKADAHGSPRLQIAHR